MMRIAVCIPTYNNANNIELLLKNEEYMSKRSNVDIYIYDSSNDETASNVVDKYALKYHNLRYRRVDETISSAEKVFRIYREMSELNYDYIWMTHDHTVIYEPALQYVIDNLDKDVGIYSINLHADKYSCVEMHSLDEFMIMNAWILNRFGASIVSVQKFINGTKWCEMYSKYLTKDMHNYAHVGYYLERMSQLKGIKCIQINIPHEYFYDFQREKKRSWDDRTIQITSKCWGKVIWSQPNRYSKKAKKTTLKSIGKTEITMHKLIDLRYHGYYNIKVFNECIIWFYRMFSLFDLMKFFLVAVFPYRISFCIFNISFKRKIKREIENNKKIVIYGAGNFAVRCAERFETVGIAYDGFIVKTMDDNPNELLQHKVYVAEQYIKDNNCFVIIAVSRQAMIDVKRYLNEISNNSCQYVEFGNI